jgi:hypothetical protein
LEKGPDTLYSPVFVETTQGTFEVGFDVTIQGNTLILEGIVYHLTIRDPHQLRGRLAREVFEGLVEVRQQARAQGFESLRIFGRRHENSSSATIGEYFDRTWDLTAP